MKKIELVSRVKNVLRRVANKGKTEQRLSRRIQIILLLSRGHSPMEISKDLGISRPTVYQWQERWQANEEKTHYFLEEHPPEKDLREWVISILSDFPRSGKPPDFSAEAITRLVAMACESPEDSGYPVSHWSARELRQELIKRQIVPDISERSVGRFLKGNGSQTSSHRLLVNASD